MKPYLVDQENLPEEYISIHTSDRNLFRRCRRKWSFQSSLKMGLEMKMEIQNANLWFGTGFHFALEDYHGYNHYKNPVKAFKDYTNCFNKKEKTDAILALEDIGVSMLEHYYKDWLPRRNHFKTYFLDGKPQVEVEVSIAIPELSDIFGIPVLYQMKMDRVVIDAEGRLWIQDYKTAASIDTAKLETDPQVTAYIWGFPLKYAKKAEGMVYSQFRKATIEEPRILKNGKISKDKKQNTTYDKYLQTVKEANSGVVPEDYKEVLEHLRNQEDEYGDNFIRTTLVRRNHVQGLNEYQKILAESYEMLASKTSLYPNPTRDCAWDCDFKDVCITMDDGADWKSMLHSEYQQKKEEKDLWRNKLKNLKS